MRSHTHRFLRPLLACLLVVTPAAAILPAATGASAVSPGYNAPDLAKGGTASASSTESAGVTANLAFDDNPATRWASASNNNESIQVDLGTAQSVGSVVLTWEGAYGRDYDIQASPDGLTWPTTLFQRRGHVGAG
ncbi:discoidin domain-containing protein, partial [Kitasatospora sp. NPDC057015]|uniref:discoidin domain-containing protein n=1 Tax=Kitasatospora sp. NPDC057015 TaxID=3346001 RepID=UPI00362B6C1B